MNKIQNKLMSFKIDIKIMSMVFVILYILMLIPLYVIAFYNWPSADDYSMGIGAYNAWKESHNIFSVLWQGIYMSGYDWMNWTGFYTCTFFMSIPLNAFGSQYYFIGTLISLTFFHIAIWYMFSCIFIRFFKMDKYLSRILIVLIMFMCVQCLMPEGRMEMFYWYCSAGGYTLTYSLGFILIGMLATVLSLSNVKKVYLVLVSVVAILAGGANYPTALELSLITVAVAILTFILPEWKKHKEVLIPIAFYLVGFLLSVLAPGNSVRESGTTGYGPFQAVLISLYYTARYAITEWTTWSVLVIVLMTLPLWWKGVEKVGFSFKYPILVSIYGYGLVSATVTAPLFGVGNIIAGRLCGQFYMQYIMVLTLVVGYWVGWFKKNLYPNISETTGGEKNTLSPIYTKYYIVLFAFFIFASVMSIKDDNHYYAFSSAITDLANGSAAQYREENLAREEILLDDSIKDVVFDSYSIEPKLLFYTDISTDEDDWINNSMERYYDKNSIVRK